MTFATQSVVLAWSPSTDPNVVGYRVYYGVASRTYTNMVDVGSATNATISGLVDGTTYYFAATAYNSVGLESVYSSEVVYTVPLSGGNLPPTLNPLGNLSVIENAGLQTVNLSGITSGGGAQTLTVTASSSNTGLIPNPTVSYTSPNTTGTLTFTPVPNAVGSATVTVQVDDGGVSNNIVTQTFTVIVYAVNQPPTLNALSNFTINEDAGLQTVNLSGITSGGEAQTLTVTASSSNTGLIPNPTVSYTSPNTTGTLTFAPVANANGSATLTVQVNDGGASNNLVTRTFTVAVSAVNDPPTLDPISNITIAENAGAQTVNLSGITSGAPNENQTLRVTASSSNTGLVPNPTVSYTSPNATGILTFTPVANASGSATLTVQVNDGGASNNLVTHTFTVTVSAVNLPPTLNPLGNLSVIQNAGLQTVNLSGITSGGGAQTLTVTANSSNTGLIPNPTVSYTSPNTTGTLTFTPVPNTVGSATVTVTVNNGGASNNIVTQTFTVIVYAVNQPPTLNALSNFTINEDAGLQTVNLSGITSGALNENQTLTVTANSSNAGLIPNPTVSYTSPNTTGSLTFTPVTYGSGSATVTVTVNDGGASNNLVSRTFTVVVSAVNHTPTLTQVPDLTIAEDAGLQTVNLSGITSGAPNENQTLTVTASSSNTGLIPNPTVSYASPNTTGALTFAPVANAFGSATVTVTVKDSGTSNNIITGTFNVTVSPVNDPPTLNPVANLALNENAGLQTVNLSGITSGAPNENQTLTVTASSSNAGLIPNPTVNYTSPSTTGTLTFTPVANLTGSAIVTITVDDGGASNNITTRTFTVAVGPVNQSPTLDPISNVTISENGGSQTVNLTGITSGSPNESQILTVTASSSNAGLVPNPTVSYTSPNTTGTLTFAPVANANGSATLTVQVNDGGASNNLVTRTFTVTVSAVNQPPTLNPLGNLAIDENSGVQTVNLSGITSGAANEHQTLTVTAGSSNAALIPNPTISYSSPGTTGTLSFRSAPNAFGSATITVTVNDGGASNNSVAQTFTVAVNSPPTITTITNQTIATNTSAGPISFTIGDNETPAASLTLQATSSSATLVPVGNIVFGGSGSSRTVTLTPLPNKTGTATITITVSDGSLTASTTFQLSVLVPPPPPGNLTLVVNGSGAIVPDLRGKPVSVGKLYNLTAVPAAGQMFAGWTGTFNYSNPTLPFYMISNMVLQANFVPNPYIPIAGTYNGLFYQNDEVRLSQSGSFSVSVTSRGTYSGRLQVGAVRYPLSGKLNLQCQATNVIARKYSTALYVSLQVGTNAGSDQIFGFVTNQNWVATLLGDRAVFNSKTNPATLYAGNYTLLVPGQTGDASVPAGNGFGTMRIDTKGAASFAGTLADGTKFSQSATLSKHGAWPFFAPLYSGTGAVLSWLTFSNQSDSDVTGSLNWIKTQNVKARYYPGGFTNQPNAVGSIYLRPLAGTNILSLASAQVEFSGGNLGAGFTNWVNLGVNSKVSNTSSNKLTLSFSLTTGTFAGSVTDPATGKASPFSGAILQKMNAGYGFTLGTNQSSQVVFAP